MPQIAEVLVNWMFRLRRSVVIISSACEAVQNWKFALSCTVLYCLVYMLMMTVESLFSKRPVRRVTVIIFSFYQAKCLSQLGVLVVASPA